MIEYFLKPIVKTAFSEAILKFCTTNQLFKFFFLLNCIYFYAVLPSTNVDDNDAESIIKNRGPKAN